MYNLLTPIQELGFNTHDLKPGMVVKFSILENTGNRSMSTRLENYGIIDMVEYDRLGIIANVSHSRIIDDKGVSNSHVDGKRYRNAFIPFANDKVSDHWTFYDIAKDSILVVFGIQDAERTSLQLSFLDEYAMDRNIQMYYWR